MEVFESIETFVLPYLSQRCGYVENASFVIVTDT